MKRARGDKEDGATPTTLAELLEQTSVADLKKTSSKPLVTLAASDTVERALMMLAEHDILSAPVLEFLGRWGISLTFRKHRSLTRVCTAMIQHPCSWALWTF
jgi:CBS domain-containing protein